MKVKLLGVLAAVLTITLLALPGLNFAQEPINSDPVVMLKQTSSELLAALKRDKADIRHNQKVLYRIVNTVLMPHVDEESMAQHVIGREHWMNASKTERQQFIDEFVKVVIRTYSAALLSYSDQKIKFLPLRESPQNKRNLEVNSQIIQGNGSAVAIDYRLALVGEKWKVHDFSVDGVSLVQNYHAQFAEVLARKGFSGLLKQLADRNNQMQ